MIEITDPKLIINTDIKRLVSPGSKAQKYIDSEVLRRCDPKAPKDEGHLIDSGIAATKIGSGQVRYNAVYARRWYYRSAKFRGAPTRGNYWFERMKKEGGAKAILQGVRAFLNR